VTACWSNRNRPVTRFVAEAVGGGKEPDRLRPALRLRCGHGEASERVERMGPEALFEGNAQVVVPAVPVAGGRGLDGGKHRPRV
jgi:hypothetical protein